MPYYELILFNPFISTYVFFRCFSDAAVSITVTSLTNFFSFMCGVITPFPCVRIFCLYTGISIAFIYIWHITLFAGIMALAGRAEKNNRHGLFMCYKVTPKSLSQDKSWLHRTFLTGGIDPSDPDNPKDNEDHVIMVFFRYESIYVCPVSGLSRLASKNQMFIFFLFLFQRAIGRCNNQGMGENPSTSIVQCVHVCCYIWFYQH